MCGLFLSPSFSHLALHFSLSKIKLNYLEKKKPTLCHLIYSTAAKTTQCDEPGLEGAGILGLCRGREAPEPSAPRDLHLPRRAGQRMGEPRHFGPSWKWRELGGRDVGKAVAAPSLCPPSGFGLPFLSPLISAAFYHVGSPPRCPAARAMQAACFSLGVLFFAFSSIFPGLFSA